jgi:hypothetical protein
MRLVRAVALGGLALSAALAGSLPAAAQPYPMPPGSYRQQCTRLYMEGQFLHGVCRGARGGGESSINVLSCSTGVFVDDTGALACIGPGGGAPPAYAPGPGYPGPGAPGPGYGPGYQRGPGDGYQPGPDYSGSAATLYARPGWQGRRVIVDRPVANLADSGLNDKVRSIRLGLRAGPWLICTEANFGGRSVTIERSLGDTGQVGMRDDISSLRPLR